MYAPLALHDTASARMIDAQATQLLGGDAYVLMQRAGAAAWELLQQRWPQARRIAVACGSGNNGGDGYVLATLARLAGRDAWVVHPEGGGPASGLAQRACTDYLARGGRIELFPCPLAGADVVVDALFGIGLNRPPEGDAARLVEAINHAGVPVLALDVPSGIDAEHGARPGVAVRADVTLQFIVAHLGLHTGDALEQVGERMLATLEVPESVLAAMRPRAQAWSGAALAAALPPRRRNSHKGESGRVLCIGGNEGSGGAIMLCAEAALRCGAGLASVATRARHVAPLLARCPEVMARAVEDGALLPPLLHQADVVAIGPGLGQDDWARALWQMTIDGAAPRVVDADALNLLADAPRRLGADAILTPHPGEAARLLGMPTTQVQRDRIAAAETLAARFEAVVVLKGAGTVVAAPGQLTRVVDAGNPGMAVGGMGDLLTGVIAALRAQGHAAFEAATLGALLHSVAADEAALAGERGLLPSDVLPALRRWANAGAH